MFEVHMLNALGKAKADEIREAYEALVAKLSPFCGASPREWALVKTKLEESCFFAKRAMALQTENQAT